MSGGSRRGQSIHGTTYEIKIKDFKKLVFFLHNLQQLPFNLIPYNLTFNK